VCVLVIIRDLGNYETLSNTTGAAQVLFSSSSAALSFGFAHLLNAQFALVFGLCCMGASLLGVLIVSRIVERSGRVHFHLLPSPLSTSFSTSAVPCSLSLHRTLREVCPSGADSSSDK
jgi:uncharacterized membrane protein YfcA